MASKKAMDIEALAKDMDFKQFSIEGLEKIGEKYNCDLFRIDMDTLIRVYYPTVNFDIGIKQALLMARKAFFSGVPTAIPFEIVKVGDRFGAIYELLHAQDYYGEMKKDRAHLADYAIRLAEIALSIHHIQVEPGVFRSLRETSCQSVKLLEQKQIVNGSEAAKLTAIFENIPETNTYALGNCHPGNVVLKDGDPMFLDMSASGLGHPVFDMSGLYQQYKVGSENEKQRLSNLFTRDLSAEELKTFWDAFIRAYLQTDDPALIQKAEKQIGGISSARVLFAELAMPGHLSKEMVQYVKEKALAFYDAGLEPLCFGIESMNR